MKQSEIKLNSTSYYPTNTGFGYTGGQGGSARPKRCLGHAVHQVLWAAPLGWGRGKETHPENAQDPRSAAEWSSSRADRPLLL
jgi:hypothetical protein